eukprot:TRINITY_DN4160_c0_g2_i1.p1 TRINITY_DN4160_c0_g2~~TRINITY_DN4160_c0_g2_i1.p1  ORF type:complete len:1049 (-),score=285.50 TRINITY_DN4160_c0_g2_i1:97-3243(-)
MDADYERRARCCAAIECMSSANVTAEEREAAGAALAEWQASSEAWSDAVAILNEPSTSVDQRNFASITVRKIVVEGGIGREHTAEVLESLVCYVVGMASELCEDTLPIARQLTDAVGHLLCLVFGNAVYAGGVCDVTRVMAEACGLDDCEEVLQGRRRDEERVQAEESVTDVFDRLRVEVVEAARGDRAVALKTVWLLSLVLTSLPESVCKFLARTGERNLAGAFVRRHTAEVLWVVSGVLDILTGDGDDSDVLLLYAGESLLACTTSWLGLLCKHENMMQSLCRVGSVVLRVFKQLYPLSLACSETLSQLVQSAHSFIAERKPGALEMVLILVCGCGELEQLYLQCHAEENDDNDLCEQMSTSIAKVVGVVLEELMQEVVRWWLGLFDRLECSAEERQQIQQACQLILQCNVHCIRMAMDDDVETALDDLYQLQEVVTAFEEDELEREQVATVCSLYDHILNALIHRSILSEEVEWLNGALDPDIVTARYYIRDAFQYVYCALSSETLMRENGNHCLLRLNEILEELEPGDCNPLHAESVIFAYTSVAQLVYQSEWPYMARALQRACAHPPHVLVSRSALVFIGELAEKFPESGAEELFQEALNYCIAALNYNDERIHIPAALGIKKLFKEPRPFQHGKAVFDSLSEVYERLFTADSTAARVACDHLIEALCSVANGVASIHDCFQMAHYIASPVLEHTASILERVQQEPRNAPELSPCLQVELNRILFMCRILDRKAGAQMALLPTFERCVPLLGQAAQLSHLFHASSDIISSIYRQAVLTLNLSCVSILAPALEHAHIVFENTLESRNSHRLLAVCFSVFEVRGQGVSIPEQVKERLSYGLWKSWDVTSSIIRGAGEHTNQIQPDLLINAFASYAKCVSSSPEICCQSEAMADAAKIAAIMFPLVHYAASVSAIFKFLMAVSEVVSNECSAQRSGVLVSSFAECGFLVVRGVMVMVSGSTGTSRSMLPRAAAMLQHLVEQHPHHTRDWLSHVMQAEPYCSLPPESIGQFQTLLRVEGKYKYEKIVVELATVIRKHMNDKYNNSAR